MTLCPVCKENEANHWSFVDFASDTQIRCCSSCTDLLTDAMRYQYFRNAPKRWLAKNSIKLNNARLALIAEYQKLASQKVSS